MQFVMQPIAVVIIITLGVINVAALLLMAFDKKRSRGQANARRLPEGLLFFVATAFGATGVYIGMQLFRHKTRKWYFQVGIPLLIGQNIATIYLFYTLVVVSWL